MKREYQIGIITEIIFEDSFISNYFEKQISLRHTQFILKQDYKNKQNDLAIHGVHHIHQCAHGAYLFISYA